LKVLVDKTGDIADSILMEVIESSRTAFGIVVQFMLADIICRWKSAFQQNYIEISQFI
jgi:hypothetical protein